MPDDLSLTETEEVAEKTSAPPPRRVFQRIALLIIIPLIVMAGAAYYWFHSARYVSTENAYVKTNIAKIASEVSGRVVAVNVHAHLKVKEDDVLVAIDPRPFEIAVEQAEAELDASRQEIKTLIATLKEARTELEEAKDRSQYFRKRFERQIDLARQGITAGSRRDELENDANAADDRVTMVRQKIRRVITTLGGDTEFQIDLHPLVRAKISALDQAKLNLENTIIKAPTDGTVVSVPLLPGEQVTVAEPLFAIVSDTPPWIDANFKETELTHVSVGQKATVVLDIYPDYTWDAEVQSISPATGAEFAILPPQNASGNWVKVVQRLPVRIKLFASPDAPPLRAGMTAHVTIDTERKRVLSEVIKDVFVTLKSWL